MTVWFICWLVSSLVYTLFWHWVFETSLVGSFVCCWNCCWPMLVLNYFPKVELIKKQDECWVLVSICQLEKFSQCIQGDEDQSGDSRRSTVTEVSSVQTSEGVKVISWKERWTELRVSVHYHRLRVRDLFETYFSQRNERSPTNRNFYSIIKWDFRLIGVSK